MDWKNKGGIPIDCQWINVKSKNYKLIIPYQKIYIYIYIWCENLVNKIQDDVP